jgi:hypothetical protein
MIVSSRLLVPHKIDAKCGDRFPQADFAILIVGAMPPKGWASPRVEAIQCQQHPCLMKGFHG